MVRFIQAGAGVLWLILATAIILKTYSWFTIFANLFTYNYLIAIYWMGLGTLLILVWIIVPIVITVDAFKH